MEVRDQIYINGGWTPSSGLGIHEVIDSNTEEVIGKVPEGTADDVERAVAAAVEAFPGWSATPVEERAKALSRIADGLAARSAAIAETIAREVGMPISLAGPIQVGLPQAAFVEAGQLALDFTWEEEIGNSLVVREPVGVVGAITPWNYPLYQIALKVAPAIAAGCTVVLKPSEVAPLNAFALAEVIHEAELPPGVFNLVTGPGVIVGEAIASHPQVDMVALHRLDPGRQAGHAAGGRDRQAVALELGRQVGQHPAGGRRPRRGRAGGIFGCFLNSGQTCSALTRMVVPRSRLAEVEEKAAAAAAGFPPGNSLEPGTCWARWSRPPSATGCGPTSKRAWTMGPSWWPAVPSRPRASTEGYFVQPDGLLRGDHGHDHRQGGDLRAGALHPPL